MPEWLTNAVIYHIFIDRFAGYTQPEKWTESTFIGGNLKGITEKLPYISSLGVNAIWVSPFYKGDAYHGYQTTDFYQVDEHYGTEADLKEMLDTAHARGLKVIADFVPNHVSNTHPFFLDAQQKADSEYRDWFIFEKWPDVYRCFLSAQTLPKLNLDHKPALDHVRGAARKWLEMGFDGLRIDHIVGLSNHNVRDLIEPLRQEFPNSGYIAEAWYNGSTLKEVKTIRVPHRYWLWLLLSLKARANDKLYANYIGLVDGVLDFEAVGLFHQAVEAPSPEERSAAKTALLEQTAKYKGELLQCLFLDNHDLGRFLTASGGDVSKLKEAAELQFSIDQPIVIYYGTEIGMWPSQATNPPLPADISARQPMEWDESKQNVELREFYKGLIQKKLNK